MTKSFWQFLHDFSRPTFYRPQTKSLDHSAFVSRLLILQAEIVKNSSQNSFTSLLQQKKRPKSE